MIEFVLTLIFLGISYIMAVFGFRYSNDGYYEMRNFSYVLMFTLVTTFVIYALSMPITIFLIISVMFLIFSVIISIVIAIATDGPRFNFLDFYHPSEKILGKRATIVYNWKRDKIRLIFRNSISLEVNNICKAIIDIGVVENSMPLNLYLSSLNYDLNLMDGSERREIGNHLKNFYLIEIAKACDDVVLLDKFIANPQSKASNILEVLSRVDKTGKIEKPRLI